MRNHETMSTVKVFLKRRTKNTTAIKVILTTINLISIDFDNTVAVDVLLFSSCSADTLWTQWGAEQSGKYLILLKFKDFLGSYDVIYRKWPNRKSLQALFDLDFYFLNGKSLFYWRFDRANLFLLMNITLRSFAVKTSFII